MKLNFEDQAFSFELLRAVTYAGYQGAEIGECLATAARIEEGNFESWFVEWAKTADRTYQTALDCLKKQHRVSAREAFLRAHNYYRTGEFFLDGTDERRMNNFEQSVQAFEKGMDLLDSHYEMVSIPYGDTYLKGYFYGAVDDPKNALTKRPVLVFIGDMIPPCKNCIFAVQQRQLSADTIVLFLKCQDREKLFVNNIWLCGMMPRFQ